MNCVCIRVKESEINIGLKKSENPKIFAPEIDDSLFVFVASITQHALHKQDIVFCSVSYLTVPNSFTLSHETTKFSVEGL